MVASFVLRDPVLQPILEGLHYESEAQHYRIIIILFNWLGFIFDLLGLTWLPSAATEVFDSVMRDKSVALEQDKAEFCYLLLRAIDAKTVVEVGTSFGVSTIYLAAGVRDNRHEERGVVIGTEFEPTKAARARQNWERTKLTKWIKLLEGDVRETLKDMHFDDPIDFVLMDIWCPMALSSLKNLLPSLKKGKSLHDALSDRRDCGHR